MILNILIRLYATFYKISSNFSYKIINQQGLIHKFSLSLTPDTQNLLIKMFKQIVLIIVVLCCVDKICGSEVPSNIQQVLGKNCDSGYSMTCFKLDIVSFIEKISENKEFLLLPGVSLVQDINSNGLKTPEIVAGIYFYYYIYINAV